MGGRAATASAVSFVGPSRSPARGRDSSVKFAGTGGGGGRAGGGTSPFLDPFAGVGAFALAVSCLDLDLAFGGAGGITAVRGLTRCCSTSTAPPSGICVKLGACRLGPTCTFKESYVVPEPCEGSFAAYSARRSKS